MMMMMGLANALSFLRGVPWQVYAGIALVLAVYVYGCERYNAGRESVLVELRQAEADARAKAAEARRVADAEALERAKQFDEQQETLEQVIENAESNNSNPLDDLLGGLSGQAD